MSYFGIPIRNGLPIGLGSVAPLASGGGSPFSPLSLFSGGAPGVWYDPSDFSTLFQDSAGTTPVTAVEQPVGLMLDKSQGLVLGPELVTNGDFSNGTTGWSAWNTNAQISVASGQMTVTQPVGGNQVGVGNTAAYATVVGRFYVVALDVISFVGINPPQLRIGDFNGSASINGLLSAGTGRRYFYFQANTTATFVNVATQAASGSTITFDNISVKELPGNHAFQSTSASRPVLRIDGNGKYFLRFDGVDDSLSTNSISFTSTDKMSVFAGVRKLSDAALGMLLETSAISDSNDGTIFVLAPGTVGTHSYAFRSKGTVSQNAQSGLIATAPITNTLTGLGNISGDLATLRLNGAQVAQNTGDQGTGNYGNYPLYIGRRNNASLPFNGQLYSMVIVGKAVTAGELTSTEAYVNQKTGAY